MAETYEVFYNINVEASKAQRSLTAFTTAVNELASVTSKLDKVQKELQELSTTKIKLDIDTTTINSKLDAVLTKLKEVRALGGTVASGAAVGAGGGGGGSKGKKKPTPIGGTGPRRRSRVGSYQVLGHTMLDTGGVGALDFVKGMGIAYGISGLGSLISSTVKEAVDYDNLMATARNILKTHDKNPGFDSRFSAMERTVRNVGVRTKFTAPQVADATKFLAMAGMDIEAINQAISPIADIALIGDTDLGETADVVTNIMTGYNLDPGQVRKAADVMTMTFTKSNTTLTEMAEAYKYSASLLSAGGISFEESAGALGILGNAGIKGSQAGTSLRTIMANLVNPTKKQKAQWDRIGVSTMDKNGKLRPLVEIFQDLQNADLYVDDFYKLFHKTAAQGAVSLAENVGKWNEIIEENFLSEGLAERLAKEKQNTIQGLWAQLTSAFTETGMQVFEEVNSPIREALKGTTDWLLSGEAKDIMTQIGSFAMNMIGTLGSFTGTIIELTQRFGGLIELWLKIQLYGSAALIPMRAFSAIFKSLGWLKSAILGIGQLAANFRALAASITIAEERRALFARFGAGATKFMHGAVTMGGAALGGYLGSQIGEEGSIGNGIWTLLGSLGGGAITSTVMALLSNPAGWAVGIAAAVPAAGYAFYKYHESVSEAAEAHAKFVGAMSSSNGIDYSENASKADKYLQIVYDKQLDVNGAISKHIELIKEQLGIMDDASNKANQKPYSETHKNQYEALANSFGGLYGFVRGDILLWKDATKPFKRADGSIATELQPQTTHTRQGLVAGASFQGKGFDDPEQLRFAREAAAMAGNFAEGTWANEKRNHYANMLFATGGLGEFTAKYSQYLADMDALSAGVIEGSDYWTADEFGKHSYEDITQRSYHGVYNFRNKMAQMFDWRNPNGNAIAEALNLPQRMLAHMEKGELEAAKALLPQYLQARGVDIFNTSKYGGAWGSPEFMAKWGYNSETGEFEDNKVTRTREVNGKKITETLSGEQARDLFLNWRKVMQTIVDGMPSLLQELAKPYLDHKMWGYGAPGGTDKKIKEAQDGAVKTHNGKTYIYRYPSSMWYPVGGGDPLTTDQINALEDKDGNGTGNGTGNGNKHGSGDYKSHYNNGNAAPKQVIVKIENLMNVESIDLSNPNNAAVLNDLKGQMAQVLIDVVRDFDLTYS